MKQERRNSPVIETMINTSALALTSWGVVEIQKANYYGFIVVLFGMGLEFIKYSARKFRFW